MVMNDEEIKYAGVLVVQYVTKHHFDNKKPVGESYHEEHVTFCCAKMDERWNNSSTSLSMEFGEALEDGYFYSQSGKVAIFMVTKDPGWYGDVSHDHWEIVCCPFCAGKFEFKEVKKLRVDKTCHQRKRTVKEDYCTTTETDMK